MKPYKFLIFSFIIFCSTVSTYSYTIESDQNMDIINTNLSINTERISNTKYKVTIQSFPQKNKDILNYKLVFDMKFRDDYECDFAGVFWIKVPDKSGNLIFESPHSFTSFAEINCYTNKFQKETRSYLSCVYEPLEGEIVIFPSFLSHCVSENESNEDRISYSFNIKLSHDA